MAYQGFLFSLNFGEHKYKSTKPCTKTGFTKKKFINYVYIKMFKSIITFQLGYQYPDLTFSVPVINVQVIHNIMRFAFMPIYSSNNHIEIEQKLCVIHTPK